MNLQVPLALAWLLPLVAILIALYLLRMRRRDIQVPASFLWPERTDEVRANSLFQRLRFSWLLVLQLLALCLVVFALARPQARQSGLTGDVTVVVLDASGSMGATDVSPTRFDEAVKIVQGMIATANVGDRLALIEAGPVPRVVFPLNDDSSRQRQALATVLRSDAATDVGEALRLAAALVGTTPGAKIVLLSDGVFREVESFSPGQASLIYKQIGQGRDNVAIEALGIGDVGEGRQVYVGARNYSSKRHEGTMSLYADNKLIDSRRVTLDPEKTWGRSIAAPAGTKVLRAEMDIDDQLPSDNIRYASADPGGSLKILLVGKGDLFLERAIALDSRVTLDKSGSVPPTEVAGSPGAAQYDIVVFEGVPEVPVKARGVLNFASPGKNSPATVSGSSRNPAFLSAEDHPLMAGVDFEGIYLDRVLNAKPKGSGQTLAETKNGALIIATAGARRQVFVAFSPLESDFPLSVAFPIFIANALNYLGGATTSDSLVVQAARPFNLGAVGATSAELTGPSTNLAVSPADDQFTIRDILLAGRYEVKIGGKVRQVFANYAVETESNITPRDQIEVSGSAVGAVRSVDRFGDFWRPLALIALLVLAVEWWVYARRS